MACRWLHAGVSSILDQVLRFAVLRQRSARWWLLALVSVPVACNSLWGIDELSYDLPACGSASTGGQAPGGSTSTGGTGGGGGMAGSPAGGSGGQGGVPCDFGPFGEPVLLSEVNSVEADWDPALSPDERTIYLSSGRQGGLGHADIWVATRADVQSPFGVPANLAAVNTAAPETDPEISTDGLTLYLAAEPAADPGDFDLFVTTRPTVTAAFGPLQSLASLNTAELERDPSLLPDQLTIVFASSRSAGAGSHDLWHATRPTTSADFSSPVHLATLSSTFEDSNPALSSDGLELYFTTTRGGIAEIWRATRPDVDSALGAPEIVPELNTAGVNSDSFLSADRRTIYFASTRPGGLGSGDIWYATRDCE